MTGAGDLTRAERAPGAGRMATLALVLLVIALNAVDMVAAPLGIPLAVLCVWIILRAGGEGWAGVGFRRPRSWATTVATGIGVAVALQAFAFLVLVPAMKRLSIPLPDASRFEAIEGNVPMLLVFLAVSWTTAGFGEEIVWRGFVLPRVARILGDSRAAVGASLALTSILFGLLHAYQGPAGMVLTGFAGLVLGSLFLLAGRNLWAAIIAHGTTDTLAFLFVFTGLYGRFAG